MKQSSNNPKNNKLNSGITESDIKSAISRSGYPLQTVVSRKLNNVFRIQEEWSFLDPKTREIRTIDILANKWLFEIENDYQPRVRPNLDLLIECKQSELPYVFFLSDEKLITEDYPIISGLFQKEITLDTDDTGSTWLFSINRLLSIESHEFLKAPPSSMTFSKCVRKGKNIVLSGTEGYQNLVLPIISSVHDYEKTKTPRETAMYFDAHITFGVGVLDAPMIGVTVTEDGHDEELIPWVRIFRHESYDDSNPWERKKLYAIDIIHKDFLDDFMDKQLLPYAKELSEKILKHDKIIASGKGFVSGLDKDSWTRIEERLEESSKARLNVIRKLFKKRKST